MMNTDFDPYDLLEQHTNQLKDQARVINENAQCLMDLVNYANQLNARLCAIENLLSEITIKLEEALKDDGSN